MESSRADLNQLQTLVDVIEQERGQITSLRLIVLVLLLEVMLLAVSTVVHAARTIRLTNAYKGL
jgi:hypothetical protein